MRHDDSVAAGNARLRVRRGEGAGERRRAVGGAGATAGCTSCACVRASRSEVTDLRGVIFYSLSENPLDVTVLPTLKRSVVIINNRVAARNATTDD